MASLQTMQAYADKTAARLGIPHPVLRWSGGECRCRSNVYAHCHIRDGKLPRGTICIARGVHTSVKEWHNTIAHEVLHLAVKSSHSSQTFARKMVKLGVADVREKRIANRGRRE